MKNSPQFYAPSVQETQTALSPELLAQFTEMAQQLEVQCGALPTAFNTVGWVWVQASLAQRVGVTDVAQMMVGLTAGYRELQAHLQAQL
ncbi:MAG: hypothetical protein ACPG4U_09700 [Pseudomonadales bacterium]